MTEHKCMVEPCCGLALKVLRGVFEKDGEPIDFYMCWPHWPGIDAEFLYKTTKQKTAEACAR